MRGQRLAHFRRFASQIGFLAGHTALLFLEAAPAAHVLSFDLGEWPWAKKQAALLTRAYGVARFKAVFGSSEETLPSYARTRMRPKCDVAFIDGGKTEQLRMADLKTFARLRGHKRFFSSMRSRHWLACVARASATAAAMHGVGPLTRTTRHHARDGYVSTRALGHLGTRRTMGSAQATMLINEAMSRSCGSPRSDTTEITQDKRVT